MSILQMQKTKQNFEGGVITMTGAIPGVIAGLGLTAQHQAGVK
jgi:hypothetical protein